jgi:hypothetical protein
MLRTIQRPILTAVLLGAGLLVVVVWQGYQQHKPTEVHDKIAQQPVVDHDNVAIARQPVEVHYKLERKEHHSIGQKLRELFWGREEAVIWGHQILIKPCRHAEKQTLGDNGPLDSHHVIRCGATKVEIVNEELRVNEKSYGKLAEKASVQVTDGKVFINDSEAQPAAQVAQK